MNDAQTDAKDALSVVSNAVLNVQKKDWSAKLDDTVQTSDVSRRASS